MIIMFVEAFAFNQNQTGWCETNILSQLSNFAKDSSLKGFNIPNWGTCPTLRGMDRNRNISDSDTNLTFTLGDTINFVVNATSSFLSKIYSPNWKYDKLHT